MKEKKELFKQWKKELYDKFPRKKIPKKNMETLSIGFFLGKGCNIDQAFRMNEYCYLEVGNKGYKKT